MARIFFLFSSRRRHTRCSRDWSSDVCSSDLLAELTEEFKRIKKISLDKKYFGVIAVKIEERSNAVLFCEKEDCAYVDENGFVFEKAPYFSGAVFLKIIEQRNSDSGGNT